jgi:tripartite-type tricarboxylate transporter receptor subunit TctC
MKTLFAFLMIFLVENGPTHAQAGLNFPTRSVRFVVPFPAGGPTDICARIVAQKLSEAWGQPVVTENRGGADTIIGAQAVARAEPDGYTLLFAVDSTLAINQFTHANLSYDPQKDFALISLLFKNTTLVVTRSDGPSTAIELLAKARANPGKMNYGAGLATNRLAGHLFVERAGIDVQFVPYKGGGDIAAALLNGSLDFSFDSVAANLPMIESGRFRALAKVSSSVPLAALPGVQSLSVAALMPDFDDISVWGGLVAPAGTPAAIVEKIQRDLLVAYADPTVTERLLKAGIGPAISTTAEFEALVRGDTQRWQRAIRNGKIKLD